MIESGLFVPQSLTDDGSIFQNVRNIPAVDICLRNGFDIECVGFGYSALSSNLDCDNHKVVDHLLKNGASFGNEKAKIDGIRFRSLDVVLRNMGNAFVHQIPVELLLANRLTYTEYYHIIELLQKVKYVIPKDYIENHSDTQCIVAAMCFGYVIFEELNDERRNDIGKWIKKNDTKVNEITLPFLCNEIKQRMFMFLLCVNRTVGYVSKDLRLILLKQIWSPILLE